MDLIMQNLEFLAQNWVVILLIVVVIAALVYVIIRSEKSVVFKMIYAMVTEAEKEYGSGTGQLKLASVIEKLYVKLPPVLKLVVSAETLQSWVEIVLAQAKETWEKNADINNYIKS